MNFHFECSFLQNTGLPEDPVDPHEIDPYYNGSDTDMGDGDDQADKEYIVSGDDDDQDNDDDLVVGSSQ